MTLYFCAIRDSRFDSTTTPPPLFFLGFLLMLLLCSLFPFLRDLCLQPAYKMWNNPVDNDTIYHHINVGNSVPTSAHVGSLH